MVLKWVMSQNVGPFFICPLSTFCLILWLSFTLPGIKEDDNKLPCVDILDGPTLHALYIILRMTYGVYRIHL